MRREDKGAPKETKSLSIAAENQRQVPFTYTDGDKFIYIKVPWARSCSQNILVLT